MSPRHKLEPKDIVRSSEDRTIPTEFVGKIAANYYCRGWNSKRKHYCGRRAGTGTAHPGQGRCWMHGGQKKGGDPRFKDGRYSAVAHTRIRDLYEKFREDPDPLSLLDEVYMLRALARHFIEEHKLHTDALLAWYASFQLTRRPLPAPLVAALEHVVTEWEVTLREQGTPLSGFQEDQLAQAKKFIQIIRDEPGAARPHKVTDIADASKIIAQVGLMVERIENMRSRNAISEMELNALISKMGRVVDVVIPAGTIPTDLTGEQIKARIRDGWLDLITR